MRRGSRRSGSKSSYDGSGTVALLTSAVQIWYIFELAIEEATLGLRAAATQWLDARPTPRVDFAWLSEFEYGGQRIPLMDRQRGIRKPAGMQAAVAIRTTFTPPGQTPP